MKTFPAYDAAKGALVSFDVEVPDVSLKRIEAMLRDLPRVTGVRRKPWFSGDEFRITFDYDGRGCVVWEPFGDNSRYFIGQIEGPDPIDLAEIESRFRDEPPAPRYVPDWLSSPLKRLFGWRARRLPSH